MLMKPIATRVSKDELRAAQRFHQNKISKHAPIPEDPINHSALSRRESIMAQENEQLRNELHHYQRDTLQYRTMVEQLEQQLRQAGIDSETKLAVPKR